MTSCDSWQDDHKGLPEVKFSSPTFPKDPIMRKKHLEDLMAKIHGSFSFIQVECRNWRPRPVYKEIDTKHGLHINTPAPFWRQGTNFAQDFFLFTLLSRILY